MKFSNKLLVVALLAVALVLVNYLASSVPLRFDFTAGKIYTLSPGTKSLLSKLEEPLVIDFYFTRSANGVPIAFKNFGERIEEMLHQYVRAGGGRIALNVIDPKPDTPEEEKAARAGIATRALPTGESFHFGLVATQADQQKNIPALSPQREAFLEYDLSQLIYQVQQVDQKRLGLITNIPLRAAPGNPMIRQGTPPSHFSVREWESTFEIVMINPADPALPANLDILAVLHASNISAGMQFAVDQFILSGKPALLGVDPSSLPSKSQGQMDMLNPSGPNASSDLPLLLNAYGIFYDARKIVGDPETPLASTDPATGLRQRNPVFIGVSRAGINATEQPAAQLTSLWFGESGSLSPISGSSATFTPLVQTSEQSGEVDASVLQMAEITDIARQLTNKGRKTIAALVRGKFKSAFPGGPPPATPPPEGVPAAAVPPAPDPSTVLKESTGNSAIIVVADTDWLFDELSIQKQSFLGQVMAQPMNDNLAFASNIIEYLGGSQDLISLRGKGPSVRPFEVVQAMETEANKKYETRLNEVKSELAALQQKLSELEEQNTKANLLVPSAQEQSMVDTYQKQRAGLLREQREIRRALREDIDALETRLLWTNLLATPLLVCGFGLWFYRQRRR